MKGFRLRRGVEFKEVFLLLVLLLLFDRHVRRTRPVDLDFLCRFVKTGASAVLVFCKL